jgi:hypothetical protein
MSELRTARELTATIRPERRANILQMTATQGNHLRTVGEGLLILLFFGLFLWRLLKSKPGNTLVECGFLTLIVFAAIFPVSNPRDVPD